MATWFHCNKCYLQIDSSGGTKYRLTNCGHIYCEKCLSAGSQDICYTCHSECTTIVLSSNIAPDVQAFFSEPEESLQKVIRVMDFQKGHTKKLVQHLSKDNQNWQSKYAHAKEYIEKLTKKHEALQKDHQRLRNLLKMSISSPVPGNNCRRTPSGQGSASTSATFTPTSGNPNRFNIRSQSNAWPNNSSVSNKSVSSNQSQIPTPFRTPSIYGQTPSGMSSDSRSSVVRGSYAPNGGMYPRASPGSINMSRLSFQPSGRRQPAERK